MMRYDNAQVLWAVFFLRGDAYLRMEPYITARLEVDTIYACTDAVKGVITTIDQFLGVLA
jgi:hypothetical protein